MNTPDQLYQMRVEVKPWQEQIAHALQTALLQVYDGQAKDIAIEELQGGIRDLVHSHPMDANVANRAKTFFNSLHDHLA